MRRPFCSTLVTAGLAFLILQATGLKGQNSNSARVFQLEDGGAQYGYRIPALVTTLQGTLLAFCERRTGLHDHARNDIVLRRSQDGGRTWGALTVIAEDGNHSLNDPLAVILESGRILLRFTRFPEGVHQRVTDHTVLAEAGYGGPRNVSIFLMHSDDDGRTWNRPRDVSRQMKRSSALSVVSPGSGIQLTRGEFRGRIVFPNYEAFADGEGHRTLANSASFSDDGGETWQVSPLIATGDVQGQGNEAQLVELADGSILMSARLESARPGRFFASSHDGGETWRDPRLVDALVTPPCMSSIIRLDWPDGEKKGLLLHSLPNSPNQRSNGTLFYSRDEGQTWIKGVQIEPGGFAYSSLTRLANGNIGCLYESEKYQSIVFVEISRDSIVPLGQD